MQANNVRKYRETLMMSKTELARKAGLSTLTIDRVESGRPCRLETKRRLLIALGLPVTERRELFDAIVPALTPPCREEVGLRFEDASSL
ncbi:MAG: helix-turn-helix transcriptional regulator [Myxococcota bacterium]|nr:helix-turn-helix transcriptional regulator [Myxococcota bacterium]